MKKMRRLSCLVLLGASILISPAGARDGTVIATLDPRQFAARTGSPDQSQAEKISHFAFLSEDLVLVTTDLRLLLFSAASGRVKLQVYFPISDSVQVVTGGFALSTSDGLQFCLPDLTCKRVVEPVLSFSSSPLGRQVAFESLNRHTTGLIDVISNKIVFQVRAESRPREIVHRAGGDYDLGGRDILPKLVPGDELSIVVIPAFSGVLRGVHRITESGKLLLEIEPRKVFLRNRDGSQNEIPAFRDKREISNLRFLNRQRIGYVREKSAVVADLNGRELFSFPLMRWWFDPFLSCSNGDHFGIVEHGYTQVNRLLNPLDFENTRPENFARIRVFNMQSGKEEGHEEWDPKQYYFPPALSPSGKRLARIRSGVLEIMKLD